MESRTSAGTHKAVGGGAKGALGDDAADALEGEPSKPTPRPSQAEERSRLAAEAAKTGVGCVERLGVSLDSDQAGVHALVASRVTRDRAAIPQPADSFSGAAAGPAAYAKASVGLLLSTRQCRGDARQFLEQNNERMLKPMRHILSESEVLSSVRPHSDHVFFFFKKKKNTADEACPSDWLGDGPPLAWHEGEDLRRCTTKQFHFRVPTRCGTCLLRDLRASGGALAWWRLSPRHGTLNPGHLRRKRSFPSLRVPRAVNFGFGQGTARELHLIGTETYDLVLSADDHVALSLARFACGLLLVFVLVPACLGKPCRLIQWHTGRREVERPRLHRGDGLGGCRRSMFTLTTSVCELKACRQSSRGDARASRKERLMDAHGISWSLTCLGLGGERFVAHSVYQKWLDIFPKTRNMFF